MNEDCWLNINGVAPASGGAPYQAAIQSYVKLLHQYGLYAILDLHWNAPGTTKATGQQVMPDADHAPAFWTSVASVFKSDPAVLFELYNEPHHVNSSCWRNGCTSPGCPTAGMLSLASALRFSGAHQPLIGGRPALFHALPPSASHLPLY